MFGPLAPGSKVEVGDFTVRLDESSDGSMLVYARLKGDSQESRILLSPSSRLRLLPSTPRLLPSPGIASCIMVELENPIVVSPGESVTSRITVPIDFVVESFTSDSKGSVVDVFHPLKAPKLALYGEPTEGFICRYWRTSIGGEASVGSASARLTVRNEWEKPGKVSLIVAPLPGLRIYYRPGSWE
ncbi:MAG: DUF432 domain-containing protein, partial [Desulfurococcales archaeon]|nr:DUF432 domain-containing protein [Desulfurococcales archaeon]